MNNSLYRRTLLQVYANAGENILMGSTSMGVGSADIQIYNSVGGRIGAETLSSPVFKCSTQRATNPTWGKITSRTQELAGPAPTTNGYTPCSYTAASNGIYYVVFYPTAGNNADNDLPFATGNIDFGSGFTDPSGSTNITAWDVTVRNPNSSTPNADINGRLFTDYLALSTGGNGRPIFPTFYIVTKDGYQYQTDINGADPNGFVIYGNDVGFYDSDGKTPLYHNVLSATGQSALNSAYLSVQQGGTNLALPNHVIFFSNPQTNSQGANASITALNIPINPGTPSISNPSFTGTATNNNSIVNTGGTFTFNSSTPGVYEIVISRGTDFDPANTQNRVLRGIMSISGVQTVSWDGKDNSGNFFPVGTNYPFHITAHAGEYHFPLLDAESSTLGAYIHYSQCHQSFGIAHRLL